MEKNEKLFFDIKKENGITLVALIITVIVMLILAGVSISVLTSDGGLFDKTKNAAQAYEDAAQKEADDMQKWLNEVDNYLEGLPPIDDNPIVKDEAVIGIVVDENQTFDGRLKGTYDNPIIPKGFSPENENDAEWGTENGWQKGLVIKDESGNEFVWVPVDGITIKFERQDWKNSDGQLLTLPENTTVGVDIATQYVELIPNEITTSVNENGGFYIARYEVGQKENEKIVSKKGASVYNYVNWDTAKIDAEAMYASSDRNYGAISTLIYAAQWDATLKFIQEHEDSLYAIDSTGKGNYSGTSGGDTTNAAPATCGVLEAFRKNNIYDMAGNVWEWTMEQYSTNRVSRGGSYRYTTGSGSNYPASYRNNAYPSDTYSTVGFRVALYIK